jgi:hypothetical protein
MESIASIDFSINSTCVTILSDQGYHWHHFGRERTKYIDLGSDGFTRHIFPKRERGEDYCLSERAKLNDAEKFCSSISSIISTNNVSAVAFEGHSFNSKGNSLLELVSYQFLLRSMLISVAEIPLSRMFFYSPITVKAFAGGARFKKVDMLNSFLSSDDPVLKKSHVFSLISNQMDLVLRGEDVSKPVDDLVDSYWIVKKLQQDV